MGSEAKKMSSIRSYRDLRVWQEAMELTELCYKRTAGFPKCEIYGLQSQVRRAAVSVVSNIAEGHSRQSRAAYLNHLSIALGSQAEVETQIELSLRLAYLSDSEAKEILDLAARVGRQLHALMASLGKGRISHSPSSQHLAPSPKSPAPSPQKEVTA